MNTFFKLNVLDKIFNKLKLVNYIILSIALILLIHDLFILHIKWEVSQKDAYVYSETSMNSLCKAYLKELETLKLTFKNDDYMYIKQRESSLKVATTVMTKLQLVQEIHCRLNTMKVYNKNISYNKIQPVYVRILNNCSLYARWYHQQEENDNSITHKCMDMLLNSYFKLKVRCTEMSVSNSN